MSSAASTAWQAGSASRWETPLSAVMTRAVVCVRPGEPADKALRLLVEHAVNGLPVVDGEGRPIGMLSRGDLLEERLEVLTDGERAGLARVGDLMTAQAVSLPETASVAEASELMASYGVHRVPVVDGAGRLVGIVSVLDVLRWLSLGLSPTPRD
jgi:CBS domain-containing protein